MSDESDGATSGVVSTSIACLSPSGEPDEGGVETANATWGDDELDAAARRVTLRG